MQTHTARVEDITMRWEETGSGDPVILIHGIPTCPALWRDVAPLIRNRRVLAWEMPGYGASIPEGRDRDISVGTQADYLVAWMRAQGIHRAILAGHDLGGGVAQIAAVRGGIPYAFGAGTELVNLYLEVGLNPRQKIADSSDFEVAWQRVDFYGLCPRCAAAKRRGELSEV